MRIASLFFFSCLVAAWIWGISPSSAQAVYQPTAEQMQLLNQLPPEQRQQALNALRDFQQQQRQQEAERAGSPSTSGGEIGDGALAPSATLPLPLPEEEARPTAEAGSSIIVTLTPLENLTPEQQARLETDPVLRAIRGSRYYELNNFGVLELPGLPGIPLRGLTGDAVEQRLAAEPALSLFDVRATLLGVEQMGAAALEPFGYDLFKPQGPGTTPAFGDVGFESRMPAMGPVPPDYVVGPGDQLRVQLFGNINSIYELEVSRDGTLNIPELGPVNVAGLRYSELRTEIEGRVQEMLIGTQVSVTMGQLRTVRVFVLGDVSRPGSYVVSSLATISSALYASGGISKVGTLRDIQLKRRGDIIARLDLYDLLLQGDTSDDVRLQQGDAIFVPPVGTTIGVGGAVKRPAIYEVKGGITLGEVMQLAGGLVSEAYPEGSTLERIGEDRVRNVLNIDLSSDTGRSMRVENGDTLLVPRVLPELRDTVILEGHVHRPGPYEWFPGMRLTDVLPSLAALKPKGDAQYILIRREIRSHLLIDTFSADLATALENRDSDSNILLQSQDIVYVFSLEFGRQRIIQPLLEELKLQAEYGDLYEEVRVQGLVRAPGAYPLEEGMRLSDLVRAGGNLAEGAYTHAAELTRFRVLDGEQRSKRIVNVDLEAALRGDPEADLLLAPYDHLNISPVPGWNSQWSVTVEGEVRFPGEYQILRGETLSQLMKRVGGLTDEAFPEGAIFLREGLRQREREQIEVLADRLESELLSMSLESGDAMGPDAMGVGRSLLAQLRSTEPVGRLVIDLDGLLEATSLEHRASDVELKHGDRLLVPGRSQSVTVIGEAQYPASHLYDPAFTRDEYIVRSGGLTRRADEDLIYVVRASGSVISEARSPWFRRGGDIDIEPGDTIVVPLETDRMRPLTFWTNVSQIFYQTAIAVAAIRTFDN